ncbi:MAG: N-acetylmuramoyl-L-alanine amidase [Gammaproteobacteria bacterium]|nr:MAG: N-acetylmuramoyl-L-alanine amidase [Gammaproteobacteria bacterium]
MTKMSKILTELEQVRRRVEDLIEGRYVDLVDQLPRHDTKRYHTRSLADIDTVVIHHSGTKGGDPFAFARFHVEHHNWPGIGYHYVVGKDGIIYKTNDLHTKSYHVARHNTHTVGICLVGNFMLEEPCRLQLLAAARAVTLVFDEVGRTLAIKGHRDFNKPTCPGENIDLERIRHLI